MPDPDPEFLTIVELARLLRSSTSAIYSARSRGQEPAALGFLVGNKILWRRSDIEDWIERQKPAAVA